MRVLFVNSVVDFGSTGRIVRDLSTIKDVESLIVYGRGKSKDNSNTFIISNPLNTLYSIGSTILFNDETLLNKRSTKKLINKIEEFKPDIIHLHNIHGYYVNYIELFEYINSKDIKLVWTLHDCWPFTGYCPYFDLANCKKYKDNCDNCSIGFTYPYSLFKQNISKHYNIKKEFFTLNKNLTIITPSKWLEDKVRDSYLKDKNILTIHNGIDLNNFKPHYKKENGFNILFVANYWTKSKGINQLEKIIRNIDDDIKVEIVGDINASSYLKNRCTLIKRTTSQEELAKIYSKNHLLINPTLEENLPTVNIESLACGTPIITYNTGGSPEIIDKDTGIVVDKYDFKSLAEIINKQKIKYTFNVDKCVERSKMFSSKVMKENYMKLYNELLNY